MSANQSAFDLTAATYNHDRMKLIPGHEALYSAALEPVPDDADHILELGTGTGLFAAMLRERFPDACLHLIDNSEPMLAQARVRFSHDQETLCQLGDYTTCAWGSEYDAIVSALSIHHLEDPAKQALYSRILTALRPGGIFVNADHIAGPTPALEETYQQRWLSNVRRLGATDQQITDSLFRQREDRRSPIEPQLSWLRQAGFINVDCWFKQSSFAVLCASRPT